MPALPSSALEPLWVQVAALLPTRQVHHPLGCHRRRIPDRVISGHSGRSCGSGPRRMLGGSARPGQTAGPAGGQLDRCLLGQPLLGD